MNQLSNAARVQIIAALVEGNSINSTCRMTGRSKHTVLKLLEDMGEACQKFHNERVVGLQSKRIQADEVWNFCHSRAANVRPENIGKFGHGDVWCWKAIDADSKLLIAWHVGMRTKQDAITFMTDVAGRLANKVQLSTDGLGVYIDGVLAAFDDVDFGQLIKTYGKDPTNRMSRFNPPVCVSATPVRRLGNPDPDHISTSYIERSNLTLRMGLRRYTRLTNAFSKKVENHIHAVALHFTHYNFCRVHQTLRVTPAMEAGLTDHVWEIGELVALLGN